MYEYGDKVFVMQAFDELSSSLGNENLLDLGYIFKWFIL